MNIYEKPKLGLETILLLTFLLFSNLQTKACDVCGCSMGGTNFGILPQFHKNFAGLYYYYRNFQSIQSFTGTELHKSSSETFQTIEFRTRLNLTKKIQLFVLAPINSNGQIENDLTTTFNGLGDITTFANYSLYNNGDIALNKWKHNLQLGGGIKLPTGSYNHKNSENIINPNIQLGTGSIDPLIDAIYTVRYKKWGLNNNVFYRFNNLNSNQFAFGNRLTISSNFFYWANIKGYSLLPSVGINFDNAEKDVHNSFLVSQSGGKSLFSTLGIDFYYHSFTFGTNCQLPVFQQNKIT
jgi:hypothetical protein